MSKKSLALTPAPIPTPSLAPPATADRAGRIAHYHRLSAEAGRVSVMAALAAGLELHAAKAEVDHGMFSAWVGRNCPGVTQRTAQNYMRLAEGLLGAAAGLERDGGWLPELLAAPEPEREAALAEAAAAADARTLTELYGELGIVRPYKSNMGGARPGAGRPRKVASPVDIAQTELAIAIGQSHTFAQQLRAWALEDDALGLLPDEVLQPWLQEMQEIVKRGREILEGRRIDKKIPREIVL